MIILRLYVLMNFKQRYIKIKFLINIKKNVYIFCINFLGLVHV